MSRQPWQTRRMHSGVQWWFFSVCWELGSAPCGPMSCDRAGALGQVQQVCFDLQPVMGVKLSLCNVKLGRNVSWARPAKAWRVDWEWAMFSVTNASWLGKGVGRCLSEEKEDSGVLGWKNIKFSLFSSSQLGLFIHYLRLEPKYIRISCFLMQQHEFLSLSPSH